MSITFAVTITESDVPTGFTLNCPACRTCVPAGDTFTAAQAAAGSLPVCCDDAELYGRHITPVLDVPDVSVNYSNRNASVLLGVLGLPAEPCGTVDAEDLIGRCLLATLTPVTDVPDTVTVGDGVPVFTAGLTAERVQVMVREVLTVAEAARAAGRQVTWS